MYAIINTMQAWDYYVGSVVSVHRTAEAAEAADAKLQRAVKRANGQNSYLPTVIRKLNCRAQNGDMIDRSEIVSDGEQS